MIRLQRIDIPAGSPNAGRPSSLLWLPLANLRVDPSYQRDMDDRGRAHVRKIAAGFVWNKFAPVIVTRVPGDEEVYAVIDGQHRSTAALSLGYQQVPCLVVNVSGQEAAGIFSAVNGVVRRINAIQAFKAALAAQEDWAVAVEDVTAAHGIHVLRHPVSSVNQKPWQTNSVGRLRRVFDRHGRDVLAGVVMLLKAAPHGDVPGFINSKTIEVALADLLKSMLRGEAPQVAAQRMVDSLHRTPAKADPAVQRVEVKGFSLEDEKTAARIAELKAKGFNRSMTAATTRLRQAVIDKYWGQS
jgi:hypothetical protein